MGIVFDNYLLVKLLIKHYIFNLVIVVFCCKFSKKII